MADVFLDRANSFTLVLTQEGAAPVADSIIKADIYIPGRAFADGVAQILDTDGAYLELTDNATRIKATLGALDIRRGEHKCFVSVYDALNADGFAWDTFQLTIIEWPKGV